MRSWSTRRWQKGLPRSSARCPPSDDAVSRRSLIPQPEPDRSHDPDDESRPPDGQGPRLGHLLPRGRTEGRAGDTPVTFGPRTHTVLKQGLPIPEILVGLSYRRYLVFQGIGRRLTPANPASSGISTGPPSCW